MTLLRSAGPLVIIMFLLRSAGPPVGQGLPPSRTARASSRLGRLQLKMRELARKQKPFKGSGSSIKLILVSKREKEDQIVSIL